MALTKQETEIINQHVDRFTSLLCCASVQLFLASDAGFWNGPLAEGALAAVWSRKHHTMLFRMYDPKVSCNKAEQAQPLSCVRGHRRRP